MTRTVVTSGRLGDEPTVTLQHEASLLVVALRGATILRWVVDLGDGAVDLLDGYRDADELRSQDAVRNGIMAPFCDRVAHAVYVFDGRAYDLLPDSASRLVYHGLVRSMPFALDNVGSDDEPIGDAVLDVGYLAGGPTVVRSPSSGVELTLTQDSGLVHVFTGDTIARDRRRAIAVEPVETLTDAFNRPDCAAAIRLEPGARRTFSATATVTRAASTSSVG